MSFYHNQDKARRNTGLLITYLVVAVVLIVAAVNLVTYYAMVATLSFDGDLKSWLTSSQSIAITLIILLAILGASAVRTAQLSRGGEAVAEMAGATPVDPSTRDPKERQLLNVTEEMAIASGSPVPKVFVMRREAGIRPGFQGASDGAVVDQVFKDFDIRHDFCPVLLIGCGNAFSVEAKLYGTSRETVNAWG